jgi:hypothetical protein
MAERAVATAKAPEAKQTCPNSCKRIVGSNSSGSTADKILQLQRTAGNQAVQRLIKSGALQAKLRIGQPNNIYEQGADRVAEQVMRMPEPIAVSQTDPLMQRVCKGCEDAEPRRQPIKEEERKLRRQQKEEEDEEFLQAKKTSGHNTEMASDIESSLNSIRGGGKPLAESERVFFEPRFGRDFSQVRLHTDTRAAATAQAVNARAFTVGHDVVFGMGQYTPGMSQGRMLMAHELTHVMQQDRTSSQIVQRFVAEDASEEMIGKTFFLNKDLNVSGITLPQGSTVVITTWSNDKTSVTANFRSGTKVSSVIIEKNYLVPAGDTKSGLSQYHAGVAGVEKKYSELEKKISDQEKVVSDWKAKEKNYTTPKGHTEWQRQMDVKQSELTDLKYKLMGEGYTSATLPERLKTTIGGKKVSIIPQSTLLNKALIEETMFNAFDENIVNWVSFYNKSIGSKKKWSALDANLVKSMLYQESHMGTQGDFLKLPPYTRGQRMTRFNIGQAIDSSGPQQILMIKEISPAIATKYDLDQVTTDMYDAQARRKELVAKGKAINPAEQMELASINSRSNNGLRWNDFFTSDTRWEAAVEEFFTETTKARNLDYDYWIRTAIRWLFEKRDSERDWNSAIKAYNGSGSKAEIYKKDVVGRSKAAKAAKGNFIPKQHY